MQCRIGLLKKKGFDMTTLLITTFCLGCCVGMIYTYVISQAIERKRRKKNDHPGT